MSNHPEPFSSNLNNLLVSYEIFSDGEKYGVLERTFKPKEDVLSADSIQERVWYLTQRGFGPFDTVEEAQEGLQQMLSVWRECVNKTLQQALQGVADE